MNKLIANLFFGLHIVWLVSAITLWIFALVMKSQLIAFIGFALIGATIILYLIFGECILTKLELKYDCERKYVTFSYRIFKFLFKIELNKKDLRCVFWISMSLGLICYFILML